MVLRRRGSMVCLHTENEEVRRLNYQCSLSLSLSASHTGTQTQTETLLLSLFSHFCLFSLIHLRHFQLPLLLLLLLPLPSLSLSLSFSFCLSFTLSLFFPLSSCLALTLPSFRRHQNYSRRISFKLQPHQADIPSGK